MKGDNPEKESRPYKENIKESIEQLSEIIDQREDKLEEQNEQQKQRIEELRRTSSILRKYIDHVPQTEAEINEVMSILCYDSFAYCCSAKKHCFFRNAALETVGVNIKEFIDIKEACGEEFIKTIQGEKEESGEEG